MGRSCSQNGSSRNAFKNLTFKLTEKISLGRPRRMWKDNIRIYLEEIGIHTRIWVDSAQCRNYWTALGGHP